MNHKSRGSGSMEKGRVMVKPSTLSLTSCTTFIFSSIKWRWYYVVKLKELFWESRKKIYLKTFVNCKVFHMNKKLLLLLLLNLEKYLLGRTVMHIKIWPGTSLDFWTWIWRIVTILVSLKKFGHNVCPR